jgi:hypothetical protein
LVSGYIESAVGLRPRPIIERWQGPLKLNFKL